MTNSSGSNDYISPREFRDADGTRDWPVVSDGATAFFRTATLAEAARFVKAISELEGIEEHQPRIDVRPGGVTVSLLTVAHDWWGMSRRDVAFARLISKAAAAMGLPPDPGVVQSVDPIVIGAVDIKKVMPFWQALMGYQQRLDSPDEDLIDPRGRGPGIWFERLQDPPAGRNRMHFAVWVPQEDAESRIAAAIAAGGTVVYDKRAPAWWTLADPEGNEADISTVMTRD